MTTSAASDEAVAPRAPIATPTRRGRQRRRVVDAVADHHGRRTRSFGGDRGKLFRRALRSATIEVEAEFGSHAHGGSVIIARDHDDPRNAGGAQVLDRPKCVGAHRIAEHQDGGQPAVGLEEDRQHRLALKSIDQPRCPGRQRLACRISARATRPGA